MATKAMTKAERRALQEKQRAAKAAARGEVPEPSPQKKPQHQKNSHQTAKPVVEKPSTEKKKQGVVSEPEESFTEKIAGHLRPSSSSKRTTWLQQPVHPAIVSLGLKYAAGTVDGSNHRCVAMLGALKRAVRDYSCPPDAAVGRDLDKKLKAMVQHLVDCRPHAVSMGAAVKHLRGVVAKFGDIDETDAKKQFSDAVDAYVEEKIVFPGRLIGDFGSAKIRHGDVVATFGRGGDAVESVFRAAKDAQIHFSVVIFDSDHHHGRRLLSLLHTLGLPTTYVHHRAANFTLPRVDTLFLGADAVYSNGAVLADAGTAAIAMTAQLHNVPALVCAEAYKFHPALRLDSLTWNELRTSGDHHHHHLSDGGASSSAVLDLRFDVTPPRFITAVITEYGLIPPTSSAVLVRELELGATAPPPE